MTGKSLNAYYLVHLHGSFLLSFSSSFLLEFFFLYKWPAIPSSLGVDTNLLLRFLARLIKTLNTRLSAKYVLRF